MATTGEARIGWAGITGGGGKYGGAALGAASPFAAAGGGVASKRSPVGTGAGACRARGEGGGGTGTPPLEAGPLPAPRIAPPQTAQYR